MNSSLTGNSTIGDGAYGGALFALNGATLTQSTVSNNHTDGIGAAGGGIRTDFELTLTATNVTNNSTYGEGASGGGISMSRLNMKLVDSNVSHNSTAGKNAFGGGIRGGNVTLVNSLVSDNQTSGERAAGGGISLLGDLTLTNSTVSGNRTTGPSANGGGISGRNLKIEHSTITDNHASAADAVGGGIGHTGSQSFVIRNSIVAGNTAGGGNDDLAVGNPTLFVVNYTLVGDTSDLNAATSAALNVGTGNLLNVDPLLGPLADNGGPTMTHALLPGSPVIDAGDPVFGAPPYTDQRGYYRVVDGDGDMTARIDMGAVEYGSVAVLAGDGNLDMSVDGEDYLIWAEHFEDDPALDPPGAPLNGDYNGDGKVDGLDYLVWAGNFEASVSVPVAFSARQPESDSLAVDTVMENDYDNRIATSDGDITSEWSLARAFDAALPKVERRGKGR
ncbi:MAG: right-handed parallel beta-helix repeat-containing protein [Pirellulales bacterium]